MPLLCVVVTNNFSRAFEKIQAGCILASMALLTKYYPQFITATILHWKPLLKVDKYKDIWSSLRHCWYAAGQCV
jgi:hypothetical protein